MGTKIIYFLLLLIAGCTNYRLPIQKENHPAISQEATPQIKLSSLLDLDIETDDYTNRNK